jgi:hypothetical protein
MPFPEPDSGAVDIPAADGYQFADDHAWTAKDQESLTASLWKAVEAFPSMVDVPVFDAQQPSETLAEPNTRPRASGTRERRRLRP